MPYVWDLNPVIFSLGPFALRWYSLVYVVGFLIAYWLLRQAVRRGEIKGMDEKGVDDFMTLFIVLSIVGARLFYVLFYNPTYFFLEGHWLETFAVWHGGLSFHGGFVGAVLAGILFTRKRKVRFFQLADILVVPLALLLVFGRIANFINGELPGRITSPEATPWCVVFPRYGPACRHPSQLYAALKNLVVFGVLLWLLLRKKLREGTLFWLFIVLYAAGRFVVDLWRAPDLTSAAQWVVTMTGLQIGQWLNILMIAVGAYFLWRSARPASVSRQHR